MTVKGRLIAATPETCADLLYAGGFNAPDEVIYFEVGKKRYMAVSSLEFDRARSQAKRGVEILPLEQFIEKSGSRNSLQVLLAISREYGVTEWSVPGYFPFQYGSFLQENKIRVTVPEGAFFPQRAVKSKNEIRLLGKVMSVTEQTMLLVQSIFRDSKAGSDGILRYKGKILTSEYVISEAECFMKRNGCTSSGMIAASGNMASQPHNHGAGPIREGEPVVVDIFPRSDSTGYWGDMTRTFVKGKASPVVRKAFQAVLAASQAAEKMIREGVKASDVHQCAAEIMASAGFKTGRNREGIPCGFIHGLGHGVGLEIHEAPRVSVNTPDPLQAGNVISNEPGLYNPAWGGIRLEDVLAVEKKGCKNFYTMPKELEIS